MTQEKLNIIGIKCKDKYFIAEFKNSRTYSIRNLLVNGVVPKKSFDPNWDIIDSIPTKIERKISQSPINKRFELIDKTLASDKIPLVLSTEQVVGNPEDSAYDWMWKEEYEIYRSLYKYKSDEQPPKLEPVEFEYETILEVDKLNEPGSLNYSYVTPKYIYHNLIDRILYPEVMLHTKECLLDSKQSYEIVRQYIKDHIDKRYAAVTSDYNFCFEVSKRFDLNIPVEYTFNINSGTKRKPKYEKRYCKERKIKIYSIAPERYNDYPVIKPFRGDNQEDLKNNINKYCKEIIDIINEPLIECPHCNGEGVNLDGSNKSCKSGGKDGQHQNC